MAEALRCTLCHHCCLIPPGGRGFCGTRENGAFGESVFSGGFSLPYYGYVTAAAFDPIEKKPLYHFRPGSQILSLGFAGCNLRCPFCQNWQISQLRSSVPEGRKLRPQDVVDLALQDLPLPASHSAAFPMGQIAYTYSEPLIHFEFLKDCMELAHEQGIANVLVSNGCINLEMAEKILPLVDAANIDLKCFSEKTYRDVLGGDMEAVLNFIRAARRYGVRLELTTLVVPGLNDSEAEIGGCVEFIAGLEAAGHENAAAEDSVPWHLSAYHPGYRWTAPPTNAAVLIRLAERARRLLPFVYTGNIPGEENDTACPRCGALLVRRRGRRVENRLFPASTGTSPTLSDTPAKGPRPCRCPSCGAETPVYW